MRRLFVFPLFFLFAAHAAAQAPPAPPAPPDPPAQQAPRAPSLPERVYDAEYDFVFDAVVDVLKEKNLADHPHGKLSAKKETGKITTQTFRYFKIFSASFPVKEIDYRDSYTIQLVRISSSQSETKPDTPSNPGVTPTAPAAAPPPPPEKVPTGVKVTIQRKFEIFDPEKKPTQDWVAGDPAAEGVGITEEDLFAALEARLAKGPAPQGESKQ